MEKLKKRILADYPYPFHISIFSQTDIVDFDFFLEGCLEELQSDVFLRKSMIVQRTPTVMPEGTVKVTDCTIHPPFAGNMKLKKNYNATTRVLTLRLFPAQVTYLKTPTFEEFDELSGDLLIFTKCYILGKMADKEVTLLKSIHLESDNSAVDLDILSKFAATNMERYLKMKEDILIYGNSG